MLLKNNSDIQVCLCSFQVGSSNMTTVARRWPLNMLWSGLTQGGIYYHIQNLPMIFNKFQLRTVLQPQRKVSGKHLAFPLEFNPRIGSSTLVDSFLNPSGIYFFVVLVGSLYGT